MHRPFFSIVVTAFNSEPTLGEALTSINAQTFKSHEIIVVYTESKDNTLNIINIHRKNIAILLHSPRLGPYHAMNQAIPHCKGLYTLFLNSDDFFASTAALELLFTYIKSHAKPSVVFGKVTIVNSSNPCIHLYKWPQPPPIMRISDSIRYLGYPPPHPSLTVKTNIITRHLFNENLSLCADYHQIISIAFSLKDGNSFGYVPYDIVYMRAGGLTNSSLNNLLIGMVQIFTAQSLVVRPPIFIFTCFVGRCVYRLLQLRPFK